MKAIKIKSKIIRFCIGLLHSFIMIYTNGCSQNSEFLSDTLETSDGIPLNDSLYGVLIKKQNDAEIIDNINDLRNKVNNFDSLIVQINHDLDSIWKMKNKMILPDNYKSFPELLKGKLMDLDKLVSILNVSKTKIDVSPESFFGPQELKAESWEENLLCESQIPLIISRLKIMRFRIKMAEQELLRNLIGNASGNVSTCASML